MSFRHYATTGCQTVWQQGDRELEPAAIIAELRDLGLKHDLVLWRQVNGQPDSLAATLWYSPREYTIRQYGYVNWQSLEAMTEEESAEYYQGLHDTFTGRKVT